MPNNRPDDVESKEAIKTVGERFKLYLDREWHGNQSALALHLGISQPAISRVAAGEQLPSGKLLLALGQKTNLNLGWLFSGSGLMLSGSGAAVLPVADQPLAGPPAEHQHLLSEETVPGCSVACSPSQYCLRVRRTDAVAREKFYKLQADDLILLETDRASFPALDQIYQELWIVRIKTRDGWQYRLAEVSHQDGDWLSADTFDEIEPDDEREEVIVLRRLPGGKYEGDTRLFKHANKKGGRRNTARRVSIEPISPDYRHGIKEENLIARKVVIIRR